MGSNAGLKPIPALVEPPPAEIPQVKGSGLLHAELFGVDHESYFHLGFCNHYILENYEEMHSKMEEAVQGNCILPSHLRKPGLYCIAEYGGRRGGLFSRGSIVKVNFNTVPETVTLSLVDDFLEVDIPRTNLFPMTEAVLRYPLFSLKCKLDQMDCFTGYPFLKIIYDEHMKKDWKPGARRCTVEIVENRTIPTVRLTSSVWNNVTSAFQEQIPVISRMDFPKPNVPTMVRIVNCSKSGKVYYQSQGRNELIRVIKARLRQLKQGLLKKCHEPSLVDTRSWKNYYFTGAGEIYIAQNKNDLQLYRVQLLQRNYDFTANVHFIDYGFSARVFESTIVPAHWYDPNLSFIAPQCLAIKFMGTDMNNEKHPFDVCRFWKYVGCQPVSIVIRDYGLEHLSQRLKGLIVPEGDILVRSDRSARDDPGHSLYQLFNSTFSLLDAKESQEEPGSEYDSSSSHEENGTIEFKTFTTGSDSGHSSPENSPNDSAFCNFDFEDVDLDDANWMPNVWINGSVRPVSTLAASYFRQLRLLDTI